MASPVFVGALSLKKVLGLFPAGRGVGRLCRKINPKGMSKVQMQKALMKALSPVQPVAPVVSQPISLRTALSPEQQMEFEVMKLKMESEASEMKKIEAEERRELRERELKKEAIERQEKAEALERKERQEAEAL